MEELYSIMRDFLEVGYHQESLLCLLKAAERAYDGENETEAEVKLVANSAKFYLKALQEELKAAISRMDSYIVQSAKIQ